MLACVCICVLICIRVCTHGHVCARELYVRIHMWTCPYACVYVHEFVCMYIVCVHEFAYVYIVCAAQGLHSVPRAPSCVQSFWLPRLLTPSLLSSLTESLGQPGGHHMNWTCTLNFIYISVEESQLLLLFLKGLVSPTNKVWNHSSRDPEALKSGGPFWKVSF